MGISPKNSFHVEQTEAPAVGFIPRVIQMGTTNQSQDMKINPQSYNVPFFFSPDGFHGDIYLTIKLLLPGVIKIVYNLNDKQIVKLFSRIFNCNQEEMVRDLEQVSADSSSLNFCCSAHCLWKFFNGLGFFTP